MTMGDETLHDGGTTIYDIDITDDEIITNPDDGIEYSVSDPDDAVIEKGAMLLDTYRVESDAIVGGMGKVWRVHHAGWNIDLALKQQKPEFFQTEGQKENIIRECESWINLGLHPHIVSCYYVRDIGGAPSIFSEWMDGGSLKDWIYPKADQCQMLYEGDAQTVLARILDIAIQFARGLHYAHERGLTHQDVKPDNLLLTLEGDAKVADFGIARARAALSFDNADILDGGTVVSEFGGYTLAYCSPEQIEGSMLTRRTDIYSWAVSVLEMFMADRPWMSGSIVIEECEEYFSGALPYVQNFLSFHPEYTEADFNNLITELQNRGYGWLRPEGVQYKLDELQFGC